MTKTPKQLTGSFTLKAIVLMSAVVLMSVTMPASASTGADVDVREQTPNPKLVFVYHNGFELYIHLSALPAHVAHGDNIGSCHHQ